MPPVPKTSSLSYKFTLPVIGVAIVPLLTFALFAYAQLKDRADLPLSLILIFLTILTVVSLVVSFALSSYIVQNIRALLIWIKTVRENKFTEVPPIPFISADELGQLGYEMNEAVRYFKGLEEREKQLGEEKDELMSLLAHQLWTPITGLRWGLDSIADEHRSKEEVRETIVEFRGYLKRMVDLVKQLLDVTQIEQGKFNYNFVITPLIPVIQKVIEEFKDVAKAHTITLSYTAPPTISSAYIDPDRLGFAISNLVGNAIDYTPPGGSVTILVSDASDKIDIAIRDTGIGMSEADKKKLFTKFSRGEEAVRMRPDGFGLGLYITRNIVKKHGSDLTVTSVLGEGSTFSFRVSKQEPNELIPQVSLDTFFTGHD